MRNKPAVQAAFYLIIIMWGVFGIEKLLGFDFAKYGIAPRETQGLIGILFAPLLHSNLNHIINNTIPLFILTLLLGFMFPKRGILILILLYLLSGFITWLIGRSGYHIGASGLIFSLVGFFIVYGLFRRNFTSILVSILIAAIYGSMIFGILPINTEISWESHLSGVIAGVIIAIIYGSIDREKTKVQEPQ